MGRTPTEIISAAKKIFSRYNDKTFSFLSYFFVATRIFSYCKEKILTPRKNILSAREKNRYHIKGALSWHQKTSL